MFAEDRRTQSGSPSVRWHRTFAEDVGGAGTVSCQMPTSTYKFVKFDYLESDISDWERAIMNCGAGNNLHNPVGIHVHL